MATNNSNDQNNKLKVSLRGGFSDRNGIKSINKTLQIDSLDNRTRVALVNLIRAQFKNIIGKTPPPIKNRFWREFLAEVYVQIVDPEDSYSDYEMLSMIEQTIMMDDYDDVFTIIEYMIKRLQAVSEYLQLELSPVSELNQVLEQEYVGYRFVDSYFTRITNDIELESVITAANSKYNRVNKHLDNALSLLSDRKRPDYSNSIKESISAVEAICSIINGKAGTLADTLKVLEDKNGIIHPALKTAFNKLYGYTSDASGIRHDGKLDGPDASFEEAEFMVVACSAFINYLIGISK